MSKDTTPGEADSSEPAYFFSPTRRITTRLRKKARLKALRSVSPGLAG
jgi:hypothetical protein